MSGLMKICLLILMVAIIGCGRNIYQNPEPEDIPELVRVMAQDQRSSSSMSQLRHQTPQDAIEALYILTRNNPDNIDKYLELLDSEDSDLRMNSLVMLPMFSYSLAYFPIKNEHIIDSLGNHLETDDADFRSLVLARLGDINRGFNTRQTYGYPVFGVDALRDKIVNYTIPMLDDEDIRVRRSAVRILRDLGQDAKPALPELIGFLDDEDSMLRIAAAQAIANIDPDSTESIVVLLDFLNNSDPQQETQYATRSLQSDEYQVWDIESWNVWTQAVLSLTLMGSRASEALPILRQYLFDPNDDIRFKVADAIASLGRDDEELIADLIDLLYDEDPQKRQIAAYTLGQIGANASDALPRLELLKGDAEQVVRIEARAAVDRIGNALMIESMRETEQAEEPEEEEVIEVGVLN